MVKSRKIMSALLVLFMALSLWSCGGSKKYNIYYKNADGTTLVKEAHRSELPKNAKKDEIITYLIGELSKAPRTEGLINVLPEAAALKSAAVKRRTAVVDLSKEYYNNRDVDELLARYAIVSTLCEVDGIDSVEIMIDGEPLISSTTGAEIGVISRNDVVYSLQDSAAMQKVTLTVYFPDSDGEYLVPERREVEAQTSLSTERLVLSELMKGPSSGSLTQAVPSDVKVISTETKDGVCFVNLSGDFLDKISNSTTATSMALFSIVNSLTELDSIDSVQILIDGKTGATFGNYVLDAPFERNKSLIKND